MNDKKDDANDFYLQIKDLRRQLEIAIYERDWWKKKHSEDCASIRQIGRKEGAFTMKNLIRDYFWESRKDETLDDELKSVNYKE